MTAIGGSIESVSFDGRQYAVTADADVNRKLGGRENEVLANGDSTARIIKTAVPWQLDGLVVQIDDSLGDQEFLQAIANGNTFVAIGITYASGEVYQGRGIPTADLAASNQTASATVSVMGSGLLTRQ